MVSRDAPCPDSTRPMSARSRPGVSTVDVDAMLAGGQQMESDELDAAIAAETGLGAPAVRDVGMTLSHKGVVRSVAERDEFGNVKRWDVAHKRGPEAPESPESYPSA